MTERVHVSIVSHRQAGLVQNLLDDMRAYCQPDSIEVTVTLNVPEDVPFESQAFPFPVAVIRNKERKGFGANHNAAFKRGGDARYFAVVNPDVRLRYDVFQPLVHVLEQDQSAAVVAPAVYDSNGVLQATARRFPTPWTLARRLCGLQERQTVMSLDRPVSVDWVGGMFMLFRASMFRSLGGFDEQYFLYYEDVDIGFRLHRVGQEVLFNGSLRVVHDARRDSHKRLEYLKWHIGSMFRFWRLYFFSKPSPHRS